MSGEPAPSGVMLTPVRAMPPNLRTISFGRKGSFIQARRQLSGPLHATEEGLSLPAPSNEEVAGAIQEKVAASAYPTGEIIATLQKAFSPGTTSTFQSSNQVLSYIKEKFIQPMWVDPTCGDGFCDPSEYPAFGRFGCKADCGMDPSTFPILVRVSNDFVGHPNVSPNTLMAAASWNLCSLDDATSSTGRPDRCWFLQDQTFSEIRSTQLSTLNVTAGTWYIWVKGDYAGRVFGSIYDMRTNDPLSETPTWQKCQYPSSSKASSVNRLRRLLLEAVRQGPAAANQMDPPKKLTEPELD